MSSYQKEKCQWHKKTGMGGGLNDTMIRANYTCVQKQELIVFYITQARVYIGCK